MAIKSDASLETVRCLLDTGADPNKVLFPKEWLLCPLLDCGADISYSTHMFRTSLQYPFLLDYIPIRCLASP